jgi:hypothetical protein
MESKLIGMRGSEGGKKMQRPFDGLELAKEKLGVRDVQ